MSERVIVTGEHDDCLTVTRAAIEVARMAVVTAGSLRAIGEQQGWDSGRVADWLLDVVEELGRPIAVLGAYRRVTLLGPVGWSGDRALGYFAAHADAIGDAVGPFDLVVAVPHG